MLISIAWICILLLLCLLLDLSTDEKKCFFNFCLLVWIFHDSYWILLVGFTTTIAASSYFVAILRLLGSLCPQLTGHSADLSLKGSPYWMAPEVYSYSTLLCDVSCVLYCYWNLFPIQLMQAVMEKDNSSDLAFAIDIWSLGCTIIEMFTGKPPWSEYEGVSTCRNFLVFFQFVILGSL